MSYTYKIILDQKVDFLNWRDAIKYGGAFGAIWLDRLTSLKDRKFFQAAIQMTDGEAERLLEKYLDEKYVNDSYELEMYRECLEKTYSTKFQKACDILFELTGKKPFFKHYDICISTFPVSSYNENDGSMIVKFGDEAPMETFLHEALHIQFHNYWQNNPNSAVSKLSAKNFETLKESLTVILDNDLVPFIEIYDRGYEEHHAFRQKLHYEWKKHHDFDKLVDFGVKECCHGN